jgi:carbon monoxide dehydrogenase subunit G
VRIEGSHRFGASPQDVWRALQDPEILAETLPGVRHLEVAAPDRYDLTASMGVGAVRGSYDGNFSVEDKKEPEFCTIRGAARGASGSVRVDARIRLERSDGDTALTYDADAAVSGALAGVGQRMITAVARKTTEEFLDAVEHALVSPREPAAARAEGGAPEPGVTGRPAPEPVTRAVRTFAAGVAVGFALALAGVAVGRWTAAR